MNFRMKGDPPWDEFAPRVPRRFWRGKARDALGRAPTPRRHRGCAPTRRSTDASARLGWCGPPKRRLVGGGVRVLGPIGRELKPLLGMLADQLLELGDDAREDTIHLLDARVARDGVLGAEHDPVLPRPDTQREHGKDRRAGEPSETDRPGLKPRPRPEEL